MIVSLAEYRFGGPPKKVRVPRAMCTLEHLFKYLTLPARKQHELRGILGIGREPASSVHLSKAQVEKALAWQHGLVGRRALRAAERQISAGQTRKTPTRSSQTVPHKLRLLVARVSLDPFAGPRQRSGGK